MLAPELHLSGQPGLLEEQSGYPDEVAVQVPGPLTDEISALAREHRVWLVPGTVFERADDGRIHNTALAFSPEGELVARYRKVFPWQPHEECAPGDRFVTFDIPDVGRIGLAICYDGNFPEAFRQLAWMGAELVLQPTLTTTSDRAAELVLARANAIVNQLYVVNLNASDPAGLGRSVVVDPEGIVRVEAGAGEELITDVIDLDAVTRVRDHGLAGVSRMWDQLMRTGPKSTFRSTGAGSGRLHERHSPELEAGQVVSPRQDSVGPSSRSPASFLVSHGAAPDQLAREFVPVIEGVGNSREDEIHLAEAVGAGHLADVGPRVIDPETAVQTRCRDESDPYPCANCGTVPAREVVNPPDVPALLRTTEKLSGIGAPSAAARRIAGRPSLVLLKARIDPARVPEAIHGVFGNRKSGNEAAFTDHRRAACFAGPFEREIADFAAATGGQAIRVERDRWWEFEAEACDASWRCRSGRPQFDPEADRLRALPGQLARRETAPEEQRAVPHHDANGVRGGRGEKRQDKTQRDPSARASHCGRLHLRRV